MPGTGQDRRHLPTAALVAGAAVFAIGLGLALTRLPEWRTRFPDSDTLSRESMGIAARCGVRPLDPRPQFEVVDRSVSGRLQNEIPITSAVPSATAAVRSAQAGVLTEAGGGGSAETLRVWFDLAGHPWGLDWRPSGPREMANALRQSATSPQNRLERFAAGLLAPGERLGKPSQLALASVPFYYYPILGSFPPEHLTVTETYSVIQASRNPGDAESVLSHWNSADLLVGIRDVGALALVLVVLAVVFLVLAIRRRIGLANSSWLAALAFLVLLPAALRQPGAAIAAVTLAAVSLWLGLLWSAAESLWRAADPRFDPGLDLLRAGRLTRRTGRALLAGVGLGAAAAGLSLAAYAVATRLPHGRAHAASVALPILDGRYGPLTGGITSAAVIAFLLAGGRRFSRRPWVAVAVALVAAVALAPVKVEPWPLQLLSNLLIAGVLVAAGEAAGLTALLGASLALWLLPAAAFSALHLAWLPGGFALAAGVLGVLLVTGAAGAARPATADDGMAPPPAFMLRMERQRRLEVEMELLANLQRGLLPARPPAVAGWEIAARSLLADRASGDLYDFVWDREGRLWIAAGDVAGHGYACAIAQAMVKAALASLLVGGRSPGEVLVETDRVLRTAAGGRTFTSLALLRLDPATGAALLANAGHPFALLAAPGEPAVEIDLPGLPLGQGPARRYADRALDLPPGATLALCSDGLFEEGAGGRASGAPYGYDRPRALLGELAGRPADEVLDGLLADWRRHRGPGAPTDDTTLVVLRRLPEAPGTSAVGDTTFTG